MSDAILTQLKILVERSVRPLNASTSHKRKLREELLAHVLAIFDDEVSKLGDELAALRRTQERFGPPAELTQQLQESLPAADVVSRLTEQLSYPPGVSALQRALRAASLVGLLSSTVLGIALLFSAPVSDWTIDALRDSGGMALTLFAMVFGFYFLEDWMRRALFAPAFPSWPRVLLVMTACWAFYASIALTPAIRGDDVDLPSLALTACLWGIWLGVLVTMLAKLGAVRSQYLDEWANLSLD